MRLNDFSENNVIISQPTIWSADRSLCIVLASVAVR